MKTASPSEEKDMSADKLVAPASDAAVEVAGVTETGGVLMASGRSEATMAGARLPLLVLLPPPAKTTTRAEEQGLAGGQQEGAVTRRCTSDLACICF
jgi:hypothetical protein